MKRVLEPSALHDPVEDLVRVVNPDQVYDDTDPLVKAYPTCFEDVRTHRDIVEQATAAPGETRDVKPRGK